LAQSRTLTAGGKYISVRLRIARACAEGGKFHVHYFREGWEGHQQHEGAALHPELGFSERRHDVAHHPDGHAHQQDLQQLLQKLGEIGSDTEVH